MTTQIKQTDLQESVTGYNYFIIDDKYNMVHAKVSFYSLAKMIVNDFNKIGNGITYHVWDDERKMIVS